MSLRVFGLTGGIGSGKSTVASHLRARGLPVVNADELARIAVAKSSPGLSAVVERFGSDVLNEAGELDRPQLAKLVFSDPEARRALDSIVHPIVRELAAHSLRGIAARGEPLACYEVPLLFEVGLEQTLSPVIVVNAPKALLRSRLAARDGFSKSQLDARIAAQLPLEEKVRRADYVIENDASLLELAERSDAVFDSLCEELGVSKARYPQPPS